MKKIIPVWEKFVQHIISILFVQLISFELSRQFQCIPSCHNFLLALNAISENKSKIEHENKECKIEIKIRTKWYFVFHFIARHNPLKNERYLHAFLKARGDGGTKINI